MAVTRLNDFRAAQGKEQALREFLRSVIDVVRAAPGCRACELLVDQQDAAHLVIVETWSDVDSHKAAAGRIPPEMMAKFQPLVSDPPKGRYYSPAT